MPTIYVIGASGYIGGHAARALIGAGYNVLGMSRSEASDERLAAIGVTPMRGSVEAVAGAAEAASASDGVLFAARYVPEETSLLEALVEALAGSGKPVIFTSGASLIAEETAGRSSPHRFPEATVLNPPKGAAVRVASEEIVRWAVLRDVRGAIVRPPMVYGHGANTKVSVMMQCAAKTGTVRYVGPGENLWGVIHVDELSKVFVSAFEHAKPGGVYHPVAGEVAMGDLARAVAGSIDRPAASWTLEEAEDGYGKFNARVGLGSSCRPEGLVTERELDVRPRRNDLLEEVAAGAYADRWRAAAAATIS